MIDGEDRTNQRHYRTFPLWHYHHKNLYLLVSFESNKANRLKKIDSLSFVFSLVIPTQDIKLRTFLRIRQIQFLHFAGMLKNIKDDTLFPQMRLHTCLPKISGHNISISSLLQFEMMLLKFGRILNWNWILNKPLDFHASN